MTGLSAHYNALLADRLSRDLGIEWEQRRRGADRNPQWEILGVPDDLIAEFSSRTREIDLKKDEVIAEYVANYGRHPSAKLIVELRTKATLATRPPKEIRSLVDLTAGWRQRAAERLGPEPSAWSVTLLGEAGEPLRADDVPIAVVEAIGADVIATVSVKRAVWTHWNLMAEASKKTMDLRFASTEDREAVVGTIVDAAQMKSVTLTPPELAVSPARFQREDGSSLFRQKHGEKYSSTAVLDAEGRLLDRGEKTSAPIANRAAEGRRAGRAEGRAECAAAARGGEHLLVGQAARRPRRTRRSRQDHHHACPSRGLDGRARAGERRWPGAVRRGSPGSRRRSRVTCENTAKWLYEYDHGRTELRRGQLVIIDEATLAGTTTLDRITSIAAAAGAKVLLVGDPHQLQSVDTGGAFALLVDRRTDAPNLTEIHRFTNEWQKEASLALRRGEVEVIST